MCWVVVSPISKVIGDEYDQNSTIVALIPMSYLICYIFVNFPSNWVLDVKGIQKGIITGSVLTAIGAGIRCFVNYSFEYVIIGQFLCAMAQPFILNAPTKIATRWFLQ
jgi:fucose permease